MSRHRRWSSALPALLLASIALGSGAPVGAATPANPSLRLIAPQHHLDTTRFPGQPIWIDTGVLVAAVDGALEIRAGRADYDHPVRARQVIHGAGGDRTRRLPDGLVRDLAGMRNFLHVRVRDAKGRIVLEQAFPFCADGQDMRVSPNGPSNPTYPRFCYFSSPFALGAVWGIDSGWAVSAFGYGGFQFPGKDGTYHVSVALGHAYQDFFGVSAQDARASLTVKVTSDDIACRDICPEPGMTRPHDGANAWSADLAARMRRPLSAPSTANPSADSLPDLIALPAWNIQTSTTDGRDYVDFSATVWNEGPAPLLVEGYRKADKPLMRAFQYFTRNGKVVGRARVGFFEYDNRPGHQHWHFKQFATYSLLDRSRHQVLVSGKEAFCLAPTDAIDLTTRGADWHPGSTGLGTACGNQASIWTREVLPAGWGDTYTQSLPGQSLDITDLPNGSYYISVAANPDGLLHERTSSNNVELRHIKLGGRAGHRTVVVTPWHDIRV